MTYWNDWDGWTHLYCYKRWTDLLCTKTVEKGIVIYKIYRHVYIQILRLLPISSGSIDVKEVRIEYEWWRDSNNNNIHYDSIASCELKILKNTCKNGKLQLGFRLTEKQIKEKEKKNFCLFHHFETKRWNRKNPMKRTPYVWSTVDCCGISFD